ncbi:hypothetical protein AVEN_155817-1 [Araneus ventricosus]|uniref:Uncharacterized protein n=1 Tax=Araneus ventricosus TaxID=182803 RepID=A0A4Y2G8X5_ARAVE|nr:hypothetical protein AVEN_155817-1 [Araneus ventricosus]
MFQGLWVDNVLWDDPIPNIILNSWEEFASQAELLKSFEIPRFLKVCMKVDSRIEMYGYCDGSLKAYSVVYFRIIPRKRDAGKVVIVFVSAKTRVNPIEPVTLHRIELCSASILEALLIQINGIYLWSDSQIVLNCIHLPPKKGN